jgi:hypothetical protein
MIWQKQSIWSMSRRTAFSADLRFFVAAAFFFFAAAAAAAASCS